MTFANEVDHLTLTTVPYKTLNGTEQPIAVSSTTVPSVEESKPVEETKKMDTNEETCNASSAIENETSAASQSASDEILKTEDKKLETEKEAETQGEVGGGEAETVQDQEKQNEEETAKNDAENHKRSNQDEDDEENNHKKLKIDGNQAEATAKGEETTTDEHNKEETTVLTVAQEIQQTIQEIQNTESILTSEVKLTQPVTEPSVEITPEDKKETLGSASKAEQEIASASAVATVPATTKSPLAVPAANATATSTPAVSSHTSGAPRSSPYVKYHNTYSNSRHHNPYLAATYGSLLAGQPYAGLGGTIRFPAAAAFASPSYQSALIQPAAAFQQQMPVFAATQAAAQAQQPVFLCRGPNGLTYVAAAPPAAAAQPHLSAAAGLSSAQPTAALINAAVLQQQQQLQLIQQQQQQHQQLLLQQHLLQQQQQQQQQSRVQQAYFQVQAQPAPPPPPQPQPTQQIIYQAAPQLSTNKTGAAGSAKPSNSTFFLIHFIFHSLIFI